MNYFFNWITVLPKFLKASAEDIMTVKQSGAGLMFMKYRESGPSGQLRQRTTSNT